MCPKNTLLRDNPSTPKKKQKRKGPNKKLGSTSSKQIIFECGYVNFVVELHHIVQKCIVWYKQAKNLPAPQKNKTKNKNGGNKQQMLCFSFCSKLKH